MLLLSHVNKYGRNKWTAIAEMIPGRVGKQCRERWLNHLKPGIKKGKFTAEEEVILVAAHNKYGGSWVSISKLMPGRTEGKIKNHFNMTIRKLARHKRMPSTYLENYIKDFNIGTRNTDFPDGQLAGPVVETVGGTSGLKHQDQVIPQERAVLALFEEKVISEENSFAQKFSKFQSKN